jgi:hypothetical protein
MSFSRQRGVVLFIALIAMVVLSLAGIGLMRSVDSGTGIVGNLAFRQATIAPVNHAIEQAVDTLYKSKLIANPNLDDPGHRYFASLQGGEKPNSAPAIIAGPYPPSAYDSTFGVAGTTTDPVTKLEVRSVIERVCDQAGPPTIATCDLMPPKVSKAGTDNEFDPPPLPPIPHYRVTIRIDWPNTNTVSFAQAFLR